MGAWHQLNLNLFKKALSIGSGKLTSELNGIVEEINKKEQSFEKLSDEEIKINFQNLSEKIVESPSDIEVEAFAYIRERLQKEHLIKDIMMFKYSEDWFFLEIKYLK